MLARRQVTSEQFPQAPATERQRQGTKKLNKMNNEAKKTKIRGDPRISKNSKMY